MPVLGGASGEKKASSIHHLDLQSFDDVNYSLAFYIYFLGGNIKSVGVNSSSIDGDLLKSCVNLHEIFCISCRWCVNLSINILVNELNALIK